MRFPYDLNARERGLDLISAEIDLIPPPIFSSSSFPSSSLFSFSFVCDSSDHSEAAPRAPWRSDTLPGGWRQVDGPHLQEPGVRRVCACVREGDGHGGGRE